MLRLTLMASLLALAPAASNAATFSFGFNGGQINSIEANAPAALQAFQIGEDMFVDFTFEDTLAPSSTGSDNATFQDPTGTMTLTGLTSGAMLNLTGVQIQFDQSDGFELQSILDEATALVPIILDGDIDVDPNGELNPPFFADPTALAANLAAFATLFDANGKLIVENFDDLEAQLDFFDGSESVVGLDFGPVESAVVPVPMSLPLLLGAIGVLGFASRRGGRDTRASMF